MPSFALVANDRKAVCECGIPNEGLVTALDRPRRWYSVASEVGDEPRITNAALCLNDEHPSHAARVSCKPL